MDIIIGSGLTGMTVASQLKNCVVLERSSGLLGSAGSFEIDGCTFDRGIHVINTLSKYNKIIPLLEVKRNAKIFMDGELVDYPYQEGRIDKLLEKKVDNYYDYLVERFGVDAYIFHIPYNEKFWGVDLHTLSTEWTKQPYFPQKNKNGYGANAVFWYPSSGGIGALGNKLYQSVKDKIRVNYSVNYIYPKNKYLHICPPNEDVAYQSEFYWDTLYNTNIKVLSHVPEIEKNVNALRHTSMWIYTFIVPLESINPIYRNVHWVYFPQKEIPFIRISFPTYWASYTAPEGMCVVQCESPTEVIDPEGYLRKWGIIKGFGKHLYTDFKEQAYCIPLKTNKENLEVINNYCKQYDIINVGRFSGKWTNLWSHECMAIKIKKSLDFS